MSFTTLTFDSPKILTSTLRSTDDGTVEYTVTTVKKGTSRQTTSLAGTSGKPSAIIDWREKAFEISGSRRNLNELQSKRTTFSPSRYWSWFDNDEYKVKYSAELDNTWTLFSYSGQVLAMLTSKINRFLRKNENPVLRISSSIDDEDERQFIILVLLYSETKRLKSLKERPLSVVADFLGTISQVSQ
ncbi:hypothetical protein GGX14DRAFT_579164 [Mycena pura]|uniref:DUF6593 domain-containing protein n=1 Tax=Mycena pura TaxID=153505 RepID=A0AAD6Y0M9_9AGAR|nr:hypothetical protein GGX14DRAFT_579164 [Mycena pura]